MDSATSNFKLPQLAIKVSGDRSNCIHKNSNEQIESTNQFALSPNLQGNHCKEWLESGIEPTLIALNLQSLSEEAIAEWFFQYLPKSARRNDGRIRTGYLSAYRNPLRGGWGVAGYNPEDWSEEPELRSFKPDTPRIGKDGKVVKYDFPKNARHNPILPRVSHAIASDIFRSSGLNYLQLTNKYAPAEIKRGIDDNAECTWFWQAVLDNPSIPVSLTEGIKKCLSLLGKSQAAIAVSSITTWGAIKGSSQIHPWLKLFAKRRKFYLTFDRDTKPKTVAAVNRQCFKLGSALIKAGASRVRRISWSGSAKGIDDFIYNIEQKYGDRYCRKVLNRCFKNAPDYLHFNESVDLPGKVKFVNRRYLKPTDVSELKHKILIIKSAKGTNKTGVLADLVHSDRYSGIPTINLSYLEKLARELGNRLDLPYRTEKNTASLRNAVGYSLCLDSFSPNNSIPFHAEQWSDAGITIDEFTQVFQHLAFGNTEIRKYRKLVLENLGKKLADCWNNDKPIRIADADANSRSINLIYRLIQLYSDKPIEREDLENNTLTLINQYQPKKGNLYLYREPSPKQIRADLIERFSRKENLLILSSSQKSKSADGTINLEKLARKYYKPHEILRIDSKSTSDPNHPAFGIDGEILSNLIKTGTYKIIIASPTICTGISIDDNYQDKGDTSILGYFSAVFSFQSGNLPLNSIRQQLLRLRDFEVDRYLWIPKIGKNFIGSKSSNPIELITDCKQEAKLSLSLLGFREAEQLIESNLCPLTTFWAKTGAEINYQNYHYREILIAHLESEGWNVIIREPALSNHKLKKIWKQRKEIKADSQSAEDEAIASATEIGETEAKKLAKKRCLSANQDLQLNKYNIKQKYSVEEVNPELVKADRDKLYPALQLQFWLGLGREYLEEFERNRINKYKEQNSGRLFVPDLNQSTNILKIKVLELIKPYLDKLLDADTEWSNKSKNLLELKEFINRDLKRFNQVLKSGIAVDDSPITVAQKILKKIGLKLNYLRNVRDGEKRLRIYGAAISRYDGVDCSYILNRWSEYLSALYSEKINLSGAA